MIQIVLFCLQVFFLVCFLWIGLHDKENQGYSLKNHFPSELSNAKKGKWNVYIRFLQTLYVLTAIAFGIFLFPMDHFSLYSIWLALWIITQFSLLGLFYVDTKKIGLHYLLDGVYFTGSMASFLLPCIDIFYRNPYEYSPYFTIVLFLFFVIELFFLLHPKLRTWYQLVEKEDPKTKQYQWVRQNICFLPLLEWIVLFSLLIVEFVFYLMVFVI